jgi:hypothetical protein
MPAADLLNLVLCRITCVAVCAVVLAMAAGGAAPAAASEPSGRKSMTPSNKAAAVSADEVLALFPGALDGWQQTELGKPLPSRVPSPQPLVEAQYTRGEQMARITVSSGVLPAAAKAGTPVVTRQSRANGREARVTVSLSNRVQISATSTSADADALEALLKALGLGRFEALKPTVRR